MIKKQKLELTWIGKEHKTTNKGKLWRYMLVPHTAITENRTLKSLAEEFGK